MGFSTHSLLATPKLLVTLALLGVATLPNAARAQTLIYDNGSFGTAGATSITAFSLADDFVLSSSSTFDLVRVWLMDFNTPMNTLEQFSGTLSWQIYNNNAGLPGTTLSSGTVSGAQITTTDTGANLSGNSIFQLDFAIPSQTLSAGTYWFRIKENGLNDDNDSSSVLWLASSAATGFETQLSGTVVNPTTWNSASPNNRAFQFYSSSSSVAPEPGTLAFLMLGGTLVLIKRRRMGA